MKRLPLFVLWTIIMIVATVFGGQELTKEHVYVGDEIRFGSEWRTFEIYGNATIEAASADPFTLKTGNLIKNAEPGEPPLGWSEKEYFHLGPFEDQGGEWTVEGLPSFRVVSENDSEITVITRQENPLSFWVWWIVMAVVVWFLVIFTYLLFL